MKKISVIIPVYNVEQYLRECLDSVLNQTLKDIEIICVDDGSPDDCPRIVDEYAQKDKRIKVIHKENGGYASAINRGLECANVEFIGIVESDVFCEFSGFAARHPPMIGHAVSSLKSWGVPRGTECFFHYNIN